MIVGGKITAVKAQKNKDVPMQALNVNLNVEDVKREKARTTVKYNYTARYAPDVAEITVSGEVYVEGPEEKDIEEQWKKNKQMPPKFTEELLTAISYTGSAVGTLLAFAINVNAPLNIPKVKLEGPTTPQQAS